MPESPPFPHPLVPNAKKKYVNLKRVKGADRGSV